MEDEPRVRNLTQQRKTELFIQMLESLDPGEANVLGALCTNKLKIPQLTEAMVRKIWPDLLPPKQKKTPKVEVESGNF